MENSYTSIELSSYGLERALINQQEKDFLSQEKMVKGNEMQFTKEKYKWSRNS